MAGAPHSDLVLLVLLSTLLVGAAVAAPEAASAGHAGDALVRAAARTGATVLVAAPRAAALLAETAALDGTSLPELRCAVLARDRVPCRLPAALRALARPGPEIRALWGAPELGVATALTSPLPEVGVPVAAADALAAQDRLDVLGPPFGGAASAAARAAETLIETWSRVRMARLVTAPDGRVVACVETVDGTRVDPAHLRKHLAGARSAALPEITVPDTVVTVQALPTTASGVVDRVALARGLGAVTAPVREPSPEDDGAARILATVAAVLGVPGLAADANLFEVGATSVDLVRAVTEIETDLGFEVDIGELLDAPCVLTLVDQYRAGRPVATPAGGCA